MDHDAPAVGAGQARSRRRTVRKRKSTTFALAALDRGLRRASAGNENEARRAFAEAAASGDPVVAAQAHWQLGLLLYRQGELAKALRSFQQAVEADDVDATPRAWNGIGVVRTVHGDIEGAKAAFGAAIESGHHDARPKASRNLGLLLQDHGDLDGARAAFEQAIKSAHPDQVPLAEINLGSVLQQLGDPSGATMAYERAESASDPAIAAIAARHLATLLDKQGDGAAARSAFERAGKLEGASQPNELHVEEQVSQLQQAMDLSLLDEIIAMTVGDSDENEAVLDCFLGSTVFALGTPAGDVSVPGRGTESDLLHFTVDSEGGDERVLLPVFTQPALMRRALLRNPEWQKQWVLEINGGELYANIERDVNIVINPWSRLEYELPLKNAARVVSSTSESQA